MTPDPQDPVALVHRMRQQLILVQVRIMELEDARDETAGRLADCQRLLAAAQVIADQKCDEAAHLARVRAELQAQHDHLRHTQHVTNEALNACRAELAAATRAIAELDAQLASQRQANAALADERQNLAALLVATEKTAAARGERIAVLDAELRAMKASRSWRWTAWLRSLERLGGKPTR